MTFDEFHEQFILCDGKIKNISLNYEIYNQEIRQPTFLNIQLFVRKTGDRYYSLVSIVFYNLIEFDYFEQKPSSGNFGDIVFVKTGHNEYYMSLDPYSNSGEPHSKDNQKIKAKEVVIEEI